MNLSAKIAASLLAHHTKKAPKTIPGGRGDQHSAKQVNKKDKFEEKGALGKDFHLTKGDDDNGVEEIKSRHRKVAKSIVAGRK